MPNGIDIGAVRTAVRIEMAKMGISSAKLAEVTGIAKGTIDNFLDGSTSSPAFDRVCAVIKALNMSLDDLLGIRAPAHQEPIIVPADVSAIETAHKQTIEAKDAHIAEMRGEITRLRDHNARLTKWHRVFIAENIFLAGITIVDFFVPTFGYFRDKIARQLSARSFFG